MKTALTALALLLLMSVASSAADATATSPAPAKKPSSTLPPPTHANVAYGPHERNVMDVWLAPSKQPTPVLVAIHGGGFYTGLKNVNAALLDDCLKAGISVVAIAYRYSTDAIAPAPLVDGARAVQFVRAHAKDWNLDKTRFACTGGSAGGAMSLWLALHDDLADPTSADSIACESTRMVGAVALNPQTTYDPRTIKKLFPEFDVTKHPAVGRLVGAEGKDLQHLPPKLYALYEEASAITHVSKDDPPVLLIFDRDMSAAVTTTSIGIHHPRFGTLLKEKMDAVGAPCETRSASESGTTPVEFLRRVFHLVPSPGTPGEG
jgi:acetyl esterase/lipase